jgi:hypothetical protein
MIGSLKEMFRKGPKLNNVGHHCQWKIPSKNKLYKQKISGKETGCVFTNLF